MFREGDLATDYTSFMVSPPDNDGYLHFCPSPALAKADAETAKVFFAEINETYFHMRGSADCKIHISEADYIIEGDSPPILEVPSPAPTAVDEKIAGYILPELCDGACVQIGYGSVPNAVTHLIADSDLKDLGIQTEVVPESVVTLHEAGKVTGAKKGVDRGKIVASFILGGRKLIDFVRDCPDVYMCSSSYTNDPYVIGKNDHFVSINGCLEIDLMGQVNSESIGGRTITGTGGQLDFILGAQLSKNGKAILCCPSTYTAKDGQERSRIVPTMTVGSTVTSPRSCVQYVVTEYGIVNLRGRNLWQRAELLIGIAHPLFQDDLVRQAKQLKLLR
jgi:acyl-CoA hydrolase